MIRLSSVIFISNTAMSGVKDDDVMNRHHWFYDASFLGALFGTRVAVTRPVDHAVSMSERGQIIHLDGTPLF